jgi:hypothetical protein
MNSVPLEQYRNYLQLMGHRVIQTPSSLWIDVRPRVFQPAPAFTLCSISDEEARHVISIGNAVACRWFSAGNKFNGSSSDESSTLLYTVDPPYDMSKLQPRARTQTRKGLKSVRISKVELDDEIIRLAFPVYADNIRRLGLLKGDSRLNRKWNRWINAIRNSECVEFWCAWQDQEIVGFSATVQTALGTEIVMQRSSYAALPLFPNNALIFSIIKDAFERGSPIVSFGLSAFNGEKEGLRRFKAHMGFNVIPLNEHHALHPLVRPLQSVLTLNRLRKLCKYFSN